MPKHIITTKPIKSDIMSAQAQGAQPGQDVEKLVREYQMLQEQLRNAAMQLDQLQAAKADYERANKEIESAAGKVYVSVGGVMIETPKDKAQVDLKEKLEITTIRIQSATKQYTELKDKEKSLGDRLTQMYKTSQESGVA